MRILICAGIFPPDVGGPATYSKKLAEALLARGHEIKVITYSDRKESEISDQGSEIVRINRSWLKPWHYYKYYRAVKKHGQWADAIYAQGAVSEGYPVYLAARSLKKSYVVKVTGDYSWERAFAEGLTDKPIDDFQKFPFYPKVINKMRDIQYRVCRGAKAVITPTEHLKRIVEGWGADPKKIKVVYNAVSIPDPLPGPKAREDLGLQGTILVSAGRLVKLRRFDRLIELMPEILKQAPDAKLVIIGSGPERDRLVSLSRGRNLEENVMFTGQIDTGTVHKYLSAADAVLCNPVQEGLSHLVLEALAVGAPVIASDVGGNPEIIEDHVTGLLFPVNDENKLLALIFEVVGNKALSDKLILAGRQLVRNKFSMDNMIQETLMILSEAVG